MKTTTATTLFCVLTTSVIGPSPCLAFVQLPTFTTRLTTPASTSQLLVSWWDDDESSQRAAEQHNIARTDLRNFLTQRSLQSFQFLLGTCRDPHTIKWLEDFGGWKNLQAFHGTGALNMTRFPAWDTVFHEMLEQPEDVVVVSAKRRAPGGGGSLKSKAKNPYLEDKYAEFRIDIDPTSLVNRIISVREQLAREWQQDLETLRIANDQILESYKSKQDELKKQQDSTSSATDAPRKAFDSNAQFLLRNSIATKGTDSSPLRGSNFDLLMLLATQESVHRVLRNYKDAGDERHVSFCWLRDFYCQRVATLFDGNQDFHSSNAFLDELLLSPPAVKNNGESSVELIDPLRIAEEVIQTRGVVAMEWKSIVTRVQEDHTMLRQEILSKQMSKWVPPPTTQLEEAESSSTVVESSGDFQ